MRRRDFLAGMGMVLPLRSMSLPRNFRITGLKTFVVNGGSVNWVFCKVYTNQGLIGLGEGSVTSKEATVAQAIQEH